MDELQKIARMAELAKEFDGLMVKFDQRLADAQKALEDKDPGRAMEAFAECAKINLQLDTLKPTMVQAMAAVDPAMAEEFGIEHGIKWKQEGEPVAVHKEPDVA